MIVAIERHRHPYDITLLGRRGADGVRPERGCPLPPKRKDTTQRPIGGVQQRRNRRIAKHKQRASMNTRLHA